MPKGLTKIVINAQELTLTAIMKTILITGGTGLVGRALTNELLAQGHHVIIMSRKKQETNNPQLTYAAWNVEQQTIDAAAISRADYIIHLAGAGVADKRWTAARKKEIANSRVLSGQLLAKALSEIPNKVKAVVSASAIGWYGPDPSVPKPHSFTEEAPPHNDFLGNTCQQWEQSTEPLTANGIRLVKLRIGIVLSTAGGALKEFVKPLRFGVATVLGSGRQVVSWIHIDDLVQLFIYAMENEQLSGVYNAVAPQPVTNRQLILAIAKSRHRFYITLPVPAFVLKLMLGEMSIEVLKSATVSANKIQQAGFAFRYAEVEEAMKSFF